jgi:hypothetical protein
MADGHQSVAVSTEFLDTIDFSDTQSPYLMNVYFTIR